MNLLTLKDWSPKLIREVIEKAIEIKKKSEKYSDILKNKTLIMLFEKSSTRTRLSFEAGMTQLGGHGIFLDKRTTQFAIADFKDEIRATMRFGDGLMYRPMKNESLVIAAEEGNIPVINACCEKYHPCQGLGDALTMIEKSGGSIDDLKGKKVVWMGIANNVSNSLVMACTKLGAKITMCIAEKDKGAYDKELEKQAKETGLYEETKDVSCVKDADFVHTDTWLNMEFFNPDGSAKEEFKDEFERRKKTFMPYQINKELMEGSNAKIMHCMPVHIGYEMTKDAMDDERSVILDQAENRMHIQKAIILKCLGMF